MQHSDKDKRKCIAVLVEICTYCLTVFEARSNYLMKIKMLYFLISPIAITYLFTDALVVWCKCRKIITLTFAQNF